MLLSTFSKYIHCFSTETKPGFKIQIAYKRNNSTLFNYCLTQIGS